MSVNQSKGNNNEQQQYRRSGRSGNPASQKNFSGGGAGKGGGGGSTTAPPSSSFNSGKSFKKVVSNAQGTQNMVTSQNPRVNPSPSNTSTASRAVQNGAHIQPPLSGTQEATSSVQKSTSPNYEHQILIDDGDFDSVAGPTPRSTPHKRSVFSQPTPSSFSNSLTKSPNYSFSSKNRRFCNTKSTVIHLIHRLRHLRTHLRVILLLSLPFFYFLLSHPSHSFFLDFLSAIAFSAALLFSLNLALPRLPSIRLFLARSFPIISLKASKSPLPLFWSIGTKTQGNHGWNSGCWVQAYSNGDVYEGECHKGKCSGCGVYYYYMSGRYEGDWIDGKYDGYGVETWARGSRYRGQYKQGLRHGFGVYRFYTGDVYSGEWSNGQSHGCGIHNCDDGSRYIGEFKWGVKHGLGHYHFRNGDSYAGEYFADKIHGFGVYSFANGHRYEGSWHEGRRQGLGMYTFRNGETQSGRWENGILNIPSSHTATHPSSPVGVYHSRVLNAVQEARRSAEKAYDVGKVDERVNRAVAAANRSANAARVAAVKAVQKQLTNEINVFVD